MVLRIQASGSSETSVSKYSTTDCNTHYPHLVDPKAHESMNMDVTGPNEETKRVASVSERNATEVHKLGR